MPLQYTAAGEDQSGVGEERGGRWNGAEESTDKEIFFKNPSEVREDTSIFSSVKVGHIDRRL